MITPTTYTLQLSGKKLCTTVCSTVNVCLISSMEPHSTNVKHCRCISSLTQKPPGASQRRYVPKPSRAPTGVRTGSLEVLSPSSMDQVRINQQVSTTNQQYTKQATTQYLTNNKKINLLTSVLPPFRGVKNAFNFAISKSKPFCATTQFPSSVSENVSWGYSLVCIKCTTFNPLSPGI